MQAFARPPLPGLQLAPPARGRGRWGLLGFVLISLAAHTAVLTGVLVAFSLIRSGQTPIESRAISVDVVPRADLDPAPAANEQPAQAAAAAGAEPPVVEAPPAPPAAVAPPEPVVAERDQQKPDQAKSNPAEPPPAGPPPEPQPRAADPLAQPTHVLPSVPDTVTPAAPAPALSDTAPVATKSAANAVLDVIGPVDTAAPLAAARPAPPDTNFLVKRQSPPPPTAAAKPSPAAERATPSRPRPKSTGAPAERRAATSPPRAASNRQAASTARPVSASTGAMLAYRTRVQAHLAGRRPAGIGRPGRVTVTFSLEPSGRLGSARISRSSGDGRLDRLSLDAVRSASPFPTPPRGAPARALRFAFPFTFQ